MHGPGYGTGATSYSELPPADAAIVIAGGEVLLPSHKSPHDDLRKKRRLHFALASAALAALAILAMMGKKHLSASPVKHRHAVLDSKTVSSGSSSSQAAEDSPVSTKSPKAAYGGLNLELPSFAVSSSSSSSSSSSGLSLVLSNSDYGTVSEHARSLYGWDHVAEPYKETTFELSGLSMGEGLQYTWRVVEISDDGVEQGDPLVESTTDSSSLTLTFTQAGKLYKVTVQELDDTDNVLQTLETDKLVVKYVRREIRSLTEADRSAFFDALKIVYTTAQAAGQEAYGSDFTSYEIFTAMHNSKTWCYHGGMMFMTSHSLYSLMMEKSLQSINPSIALPYWDFMYDSATYGREWSKSEIYSDSYFGAIDTDVKDDYIVTRGRFAYTPMVKYDDSLYSAYNPEENLFGWLLNSLNTGNAGYLQRSRSMCGLTETDAFATCTDFITCFSSYDTLSDWNKCIELEVHANMHGWHGGSWDCAVDVGSFAKTNTQFDGDMLSFIATIAHDVWYDYNTQLTDYMSCPSSCDEDEECLCTCSLDWSSLTTDEMYTYLEDTLAAIYSDAYQGSTWLTIDEDSGKYVFQDSTGTAYGDDDQTTLLKLVGELWCTPAKTGVMGTGAATNDPLFWPMHPIFEKGLHVLRLSPEYSSYDFTWSDGSCMGSGWDDTLPFSGLFTDDDSSSTSTSYYTNSEIWEYIDPARTQLPFMFDSFTQWGSCDWDPCPTCA